LKSDFVTATAARLGFASLLLTLVISAIPRAFGETNGPLSKSVYEVRGQVRLFHPGPSMPLENGSGVVAWLVPTQVSPSGRLNSERRHYQMAQHHKRFDPLLLVVPAGSIVEFPNHDPWFHNVFSVSRSKRFDLGLYQAGILKAVQFDRPGVTYLFCSIYSEMMATILTVPSMYYGVSDQAGHIAISNVPPGKYLVHVWYEGATHQALEALQSSIVVVDEKSTLPTITVAAAGQITMNRNRKVPSDNRKQQESEGERTRPNIAR
jgi:plastocyanin